MNNNSVLCRFIAEHSEDWADILLKKYKVKSKIEDRYAIFTYSFDCDFSDPIVQEARGIIIDVEALEVVCWPFRKFGNHNESYADDIDWQTARVLEKVDGSIIKLWHDPVLNKWQFSTNGTIRAEKAAIDNYPGLYFGDVILRADNYRDIPFDRLDKEKTYIFELVSPETQVVVRYDTTSLYHIGTRHNKTGIETEEDIGIKKPASYALGSLEECVRAAARLNESDTADSRTANEANAPKNASASSESKNAEEAYALNESENAAEKSAASESENAVEACALNESKNAKEAYALNESENAEEACALNESKNAEEKNTANESENAEEMSAANGSKNAVEMSAASGDVRNEGFVVVDANWHRVKVKSPDYLMMHRLRQTDSISKRDAIALLISDDESVKSLCDANPALVPVFKYYEFRLAELKYQADKLATLARSLYKEYSGDRSAVAKIILKHKLSFIGFRCIDCDKSGAELVLSLPAEKLVRLIPDYEPDDMYSLFLPDSDQ